MPDTCPDCGVGLVDQGYRRQCPECSRIWKRETVTISWTKITEGGDL